MSDRVDIYDGLSDADAQKFELIDNFLRLSVRFSPKRLREKKILFLSMIILLAVGLLVMCFSAGDISSILMGLFFLPVVGVMGYLLLRRYRNNFFPEVERTRIIIERDGMDAVYVDLVKAKPLGKGETYSGGKYLFTRGKAMCRLENVQSIDIETVSRGRNGRVYYAAAEVADEIGVSRQKLEVLTGLGSMRYKQLETLRKDIILLKTGDELSQERMQL